MAFWHQATSDKCCFPAIIPKLTADVSLLESEFGFEVVTQLVDTRKRPSALLSSMSSAMPIVAYRGTHGARVRSLCLTTTNHAVRLGSRWSLVDLHKRRLDHDDLPCMTRNESTVPLIAFKAPTIVETMER
jgi:hypothetical protein